MKKIVSFIGSLSSGGAEHQMCLLTSFLVEKGYDVTIITIDDTKDHYDLNPRIKRQRLAVGKPYILKLFSYMKAALFVRADVVLSWGFSQNVFLLPPLMLRPDVKVICGERNYTKGRNSIWERLLYFGLYFKAKYIVANSFSQTQYEQQKHPLFRKKMRTITNYTEIDRYKYEPCLKDGIIRVGVVARCEEQKNVHRFLKALVIVKERTGIKFEVDWYGNRTFITDHQKEYYEECLKIIDQGFLKDVFHFKDPVTDVQNIIPQYNLMCLPSLFEGFSNSLSEYISCGRPVLCSDVSDNHVMVHDSQNGYLFDPYSIDSIVSAFLAFFTLSEQDQEKMCIESRKIAESLFCKEMFIDKYIECIES